MSTCVHIILMASVSDPYLNNVYGSHVCPSVHTSYIHQTAHARKSHGQGGQVYTRWSGPGILAALAVASGAVCGGTTIV